MSAPKVTATIPPPRPIRDVVAALHAESSLKRLALAYGCAPKGSEEEAALRDLLIVRAKQEPSP